MVVSLRLLRGELAALRHEYIHLLKNVPLTQKLGFPDVIMPGDVRYVPHYLAIPQFHKTFPFAFRNDLYVVIERGDFERGGKSSSKNVEVTVTVLDEFGRPIQVHYNPIACFLFLLTTASVRTARTGRVVSNGGTMTQGKRRPIDFSLFPRPV